MKRLLFVCAIFISICQGSVQSHAAGWEPVLPGVPTLAALNEIWVTSATDMVATGGQGVILHYDGTKWSHQQSGIGEGINTLWGNGDGTYYAAGWNATIVYYNKSYWDQVSSPLLKDDNIYKLCADSRGNLYIAGSRISPTDSSTTIGIKATRIDGNWSIVEDATVSNFVDVTIDDDGTSYFATIGRVDELKNGAWSTTTLGDGTAYMHSVDYCGNGVVYVVSVHNIYYKKDGAWNAIPTTSTSGFIASGGDGSAIMRGNGGVMEIYAPNRVGTIDASTKPFIYKGYPLGDGSIIFVGSCGFISKYSGGVWSDFSTRSRNTYTSFLPRSATEMYIAESEVGLLKYDGKDFTTIYTPSYNIQAVAGDSAGRLYVAGSNGTLAMHDGNSWTPFSMPSTLHLRDLWVAPDDTVYACGDRSVLRFDGTTWHTTTLAAPGTFRTIFGTDNANIYVAGSSGSLLHYNGTSWNTITRSNLYDYEDGIAFSSGEVFLVGGDGFRDSSQECLFHRYDGTTWTTYSPVGTRRTSANRYGVWGSSPTNVFAVGNGSITHFDGTSLKVLSSVEAGAWLTDIKPTPDGTLYAVGGHGMFIRFDGCSKADAPDQSCQPGNANVSVIKAVENDRPASWLRTNYGVPADFVPKTTVREFTATTDKSNSTAIFSFRLDGLSGAIGDLNLMKLKNDGSCITFGTYDQSGGPASAEGSWWISTTTTPAATLSPSDTLSASTLYDIFFVIRDNGGYDLDTRPGYIRDPFVLGSGGSSAAGGLSSGGGGTGCTLSREATSPGMLSFALIAAGAFLLYRRRNG